MQNKINIIAQEDDFIVLDKPRGVSTHYSPGDKAENIIDLLKAEQARLFPVMRLDNGASGLLIIGTRPEFAREVKFLNKEYQAIVLGEAPSQGLIDRELTKKKFGTGRKITQSAISSFKLLESSGAFSLIKVSIETGRHHQIRKHLRSIKHPILGDFRHGYNEKNKIIQEKIKIQLPLCLQCTALAVNYRKRNYNFNLPLSNDLVQLWQQLKILI